MAAKMAVRMRRCSSGCVGNAAAGVLVGRSVDAARVFRGSVGRACEDIITSMIELRYGLY